MNLLNKFKSIFKGNSEEKPMTRDEKIGYLANELIKELKASGRSIANPEISKGFGSFDVLVHYLGTEREEVLIKNIINGWEIEAKPTFKEF